MAVFCDRLKLGSTTAAKPKADISKKRSYSCSYHCIKPPKAIKVAFYESIIFLPLFVQKTKCTIELLS